MALRLLLVLALGCTCRCGEPAGGGEVLHLAHTFSPHETEELNRLLAGRTPAVESSLLPFARGQTILGRVLRAGRDCPDLVRIDATWVPGLAGADLLAEVPDEVWRARAWLPEAAELGAYRGARYGLPQSQGVLALVHRRGEVERAGAPWPPATLGDLEAAAHRLTGAGRHGLGVRVDGYWFIAFLRASGGDLIDPVSGAIGIDQPEAVEALRRFAALFGEAGVAPPPGAPGDAARDLVARFREGRLAVVMDGPWALWSLGGGAIDGLSVTPFPPGPDGRPAAPRGGQVYAVPRCAPRPEAAWRLALDLTAEPVQTGWARRFGVVPTTEEGLAGGGRVVTELRRALRAARPLPRHPVSAELFDDLTPAIEAVVLGDATPEEALAGVGRAWRRLLARHRAGASDESPRWRPGNASARPGEDPAADAGAHDPANATADAAANTDKDTDTNKDKDTSTGTGTAAGAGTAAGTGTAAPPSEPAP